MNNENNVVILFDYDDTLFPTTFYEKNGIQSESSKKMLSKLDKTLKKMFDFFNTKKCNMFVVSNGTMEWINESSKLLPLLRKELTSIPVFSCRDMYAMDIDYHLWKQYGFSNLISSHFYNCTIIGIGDTDNDKLCFDNVCNFLYKDHMFYKMNHDSSPESIIKNINDFVNKLSKII